MPTSYQAIIKSPLGQLGILFAKEQLISIDFLSTNIASHKPTTSIAQNAVDQLQQYFDNANNKFTVPINLHGTAFQKRVWEALIKIPLGTTMTYGELADQLDTSPRAIGNACRSNPVPIIVPCHRIVGRNNLGGYAGHTTGTKFTFKEWLLHHERKK